MLKIIGTLFTLLIFAASTLSQNVDKLQDDYLTAKNDTTRLNLTIAIADQFQETDSDSALFYLRSALTLVNKMEKDIKFSKEEYRHLTFRKFEILKKTGAFFDKAFETDSALVYYAQSVDIIQGLANDEKNRKLKETYLEKLAQVTLTLGTIYFQQGNPVRSTDLYNRSLKISKEINDSLLISKGLLNLGMIFNNQGKYGEAINNYITAIRIFEHLHDNKGIAICHLSIGNILRKQNTLNKAIVSYNKALEIFKKMNDERGECACYNNLGISYSALNDYSKALSFYNLALKIYQKNKDESRTAMMYSNISTLYQYQKDYDKATEYILKSLEINKKKKNKQNLIGSYLNLASVYITRINEDNTITNTQRKRYISNTIQYAEKGFGLADSMQLIMEKVAAAEILKDIYPVNGNYKKAYEMANTVILLNDSIYNSEKTKIIADIETKYETEKKEHQIYHQNLELQEQQLELRNARLLRNSLVTGIILLLIVTLLIYRNYRQKHVANKKLDEKNKVIEKQNAEILLKSDELKSANKKLTELIQFKERMTGMIVHDLKNPLNNILNSSAIPDHEFREQLILQSGYDMLNLVENILDVYKLKETGLRIRKEQIDINKILESNVVEIALYLNEKELKIDLPPEHFPALVADKKIIKRIFSNLLSNAVKFSPVRSIIKINYKILNERDVWISVHNHGPAIPNEKQTHIFENFGQHELRNIGIAASTGLGLSFCKMAVEAHDGEIGVISENEGAEFWFTLPNAVYRDALHIT